MRARARRRTGVGRCRRHRSKTTVPRKRAGSPGSPSPSSEPPYYTGGEAEHAEERVDENRSERREEIGRLHAPRQDGARQAQAPGPAGKAACRTTPACMAPT